MERFVEFSIDEKTVVTINTEMIKMIIPRDDGGTNIYLDKDWIISVTDTYTDAYQVI
jgi:hypothetical protein